MKGMRKIKRGTGFRGAVSYAINRKPGDDPGQIIGGNMSGSAPKELTTEFGASRKLRPDIKKPVWHNSLRLPKGEHIEPAKLAEIADDYMRRMGFTDFHQRLYVLHDDPDGQHVHIVASRVALDGGMYLGRNENLESTRHIQALERVHALTITKGPMFKDGKIEMPCRKQVKKGEIEKAVATGERPTRLKLQGLIDSALKKPCTATEFVKRLLFAGVRARPNVANTGRMNGFSFEFKGVCFKGSQLGNDYKWIKLQEKGVEYVEARDGAELAGYRDQFSGRLVKPLTGDEREISIISESNRAVDQNGEAIPGYHEGPSVIDSNASGTDSRTDEPKIGQLGESNQAVDPSSRKTAELAAGDGKPRQKFEESDQGSRGANKQHTAQMVGEISSNNPSGDDRRPVRRVWDSGFRKASASKRSGEEQQHTSEIIKQSDTKRKGFDGRNIKEIDPTSYLISQGFEVKQEGRHFSVRDQGNELYRLTLKPDGKFLWCDNYGNKGGDNLDLVEEIEPGLSFFERAYRLSNVPTFSTSTRKKAIRPKTKPTLPYQSKADQRRGRSYLESREISRATILEAEEQGFLRYCSDGVFFCGYDNNGEIAAVTKRATDAMAEEQKKDLKGTDKTFPPILRGGDTLWIVEGGADALALHDIAKRREKEPPTVIVTGGANVCVFLDNPAILDRIKKSNKIYVSYEREDNEEAQIRSDAGHDKQILKINESTGQKAQKWEPVTCKDIAELNIQDIDRFRRQVDNDVDDDCRHRL